MGQQETSTTRLDKSHGIVDARSARHGVSCICHAPQLDAGEWRVKLVRTANRTNLAHE